MGAASVVTDGRKAAPHPDPLPASGESACPGPDPREGPADPRIKSGEEGDGQRRRMLRDLALGILFFCLLTPFALVLRLCGRDRLRLRLDPAAVSYWIARGTDKGRQTAMTKQF
jgi:hypothetical protein